MTIYFTLNDLHLHLQTQFKCLFSREAVHIENQNNGKSGSNYITETVKVEFYSMLFTILRTTTKTEQNIDQKIFLLLACDEKSITRMTCIQSSRDCQKILSLRLRQGIYFPKCKLLIN